MRKSRRLPPVHGIALLCGFAPLACATPDAGDRGTAVRDSASIRIVENRAVHADTCAVAPTPDLELGTVDGPSETQLYRVFDAATLSDGRIAVVDQGSSQIRSFSAEGTFERAFGSEGGGPGEHRAFRLASQPPIRPYEPFRAQVRAGPVAGPRLIRS